MSGHDVVIVGSGINSLVCAALLARRGKSVLVLEREQVAGGCIRSEALFPGYVHDLMSSWYPLFVGSAAYAELKQELHDAGLEFVSAAYTTGVVLPDGRGLALKQDIDDAVNRIDAIAPGEGAAFGSMAKRLLGADAPLTFGLLGNDPYRLSMLRLLFREWRARGMDGMLQFAGDALESFRRWSNRNFQSDLVPAMIAPWVLHTGLGPDEASSALIGKLTFAAVVAGGMPIVKGGSANIVKALQTVIEAHGGKIMTGIEVERIVTEGRHASTVIADGRQFAVKQAVVCNVTPPQLYGRLLPEAPAAVRSKAQAYRFGRGGMQIHFALNAPPNWSEPELLKVPLVHFTSSMEQVCLSVVEANNGMLPAYSTIAVGQPCAADPSRAPAGGWILWIQMLELPTRLRGDAGQTIDIPADGNWTDAVRDAVADRIQARLETVMPGLSQQIVGRRSYSPADLESMNCNLVGGDPYSGVCSPDQFFWLRPFAGASGARGHRTPYRNVFHIGASSHPGPGLGGDSGYQVAALLS